MLLIFYNDKFFNYMYLKIIFCIGDGCMDSLGYFVQYCMYMFMENEIYKILCVVIMDKRMIGRKSVIFEKVCF